MSIYNVVLSSPSSWKSAEDGSPEKCVHRKSSQTTIPKSATSVYSGSFLAVNCNIFTGKFFHGPLLECWNL